MAKTNPTDNKWTYTQAELDQQFNEATKRANEADLTQPRAKKASYDPATNEITIFLTNDCKFSFPTHVICELRNASPADIGDLEITPRGTALRWKKLNADYSVMGLITNIFGTKSWMASLGRQGGSVKSPAKAVAARANGQKGGRPKTSRDTRA